ncbi:MAG: hypothetical protein ACFFD1_02250 [Candidatus Thorarchaeota archaeon]
MNSQIERHKTYKEIKIAYRLIMLGLDSCINCSLIYPLLNIAQKNDLITIIEPKVFKSKGEYCEYALDFLQSFSSEFKKKIPVPILLMQLNADDDLKLVSPATITEVAMTLSEGLNSFEKMAYIDGEIPVSIFLVNQLHKMSSNLINKEN